MEATGPGPTGDEQRLRAAPEHIIDMLLGVMRPYPGPPNYYVGDVSYARAARAEAKVYADQIWAEAWQRGAIWGLARNTQPILVSAELLGELTREAT